MEGEKNSNREAPRVLLDKEVADLLKEINDQRLRADEDADHFTIHLADRVQYVPKRTFIFTQDGNIAIEDFLQEVLKRSNTETE